MMGGVVWLTMSVTNANLLERNPEICAKAPLSLSNLIESDKDKYMSENRLNQTVLLSERVVYQRNPLIRKVHLQRRICDIESSRLKSRSFMRDAKSRTLHLGVQTKSTDCIVRKAGGHTPNFFAMRIRSLRSALIGSLLGKVSN